MKHKDSKSELENRNGTAVPILQKPVPIQGKARLASKLFAERLSVLIGDATLRNFAAKCGLSAGAIHHYLNLGSEPSLSRLVAIAQAAGVNLLWLATGEGPMKTGQVNEQGTPYVTVKPINLGLLEAVIEVVEAEAPQKSAGWKAKMAVALYDLGDVPRDKRAALVRAAG